MGYEDTVGDERRVKMERSVFGRKRNQGHIKKFLEEDLQQNFSFLSSILFLVFVQVEQLKILISTSIVEKTQVNLGKGLCHPKKTSTRTFAGLDVENF